MSPKKSKGTQPPAKRTASASKPSPYLLYTEDYPVSEHSVIETLSAQEARRRFNLTLLPNNLELSFKSALNFAKENDRRYEDDASGLLLPYRILSKLPRGNDYENYLVVSRVSDEIGYGVSTLRKISRGTVIAEYDGVRVGALEPIITDEVYSFTTAHLLPPPLFDAMLITQRGHDLYVRTASEVYARDYGNIVRFINHCPFESDSRTMTANVHIDQVTVQNQPLLIKLFLVALRDIKPYEPLCFDYGPHYRFGNMSYFDPKTYLPKQPLGKDVIPIGTQGCEKGQEDAFRFQFCIDGDSAKASSWLGKAHKAGFITEPTMLEAVVNFISNGVATVLGEVTEEYQRAREFVVSSAAEYVVDLHSGPCISPIILAGCYRPSEQTVLGALSSDDADEL